LSLVARHCPSGSSLVTCHSSLHLSLVTAFRRPSKRTPTRFPYLARAAVKIPENLSSSGDAIGGDGVHLKPKDHGAHFRLSVRQGARQKNPRFPYPPSAATAAVAANVCSLFGSLRRDVQPLSSQAVAVNLYAIFFASRRGLPNLWKCAGFRCRFRASKVRSTLILRRKLQRASSKDSAHQNDDPPKRFYPQRVLLTVLSAHSQLVTRP